MGGRLMRRLASTGLAALLAACTPGAPSAPATSGVGDPTAKIVDVSLIKYAAAQSPYGTVGGYSPNPLIVAKGSRLQFHNADSFEHTATAIGGNGFPAGNPFSSGSLSASGGDVSATAWSTGDLAGGVDLGNLEQFIRARGVAVGEGVFRATMQVRIVNEGPVTLLVDSKKLF